MYSIPEMGTSQVLPFREQDFNGLIKVRVIGLESLEDFGGHHADARSQIDAWLCEVREAHWQSFQDIRARYPHASYLSENRATFNLKGSDYELEVKVNYPNKVVLIVDIRTNDDGIELLRRA
jgi:mRNA interferase HigB